MENYVNFMHEALDDQLVIKLSDYARFEITKHNSPTFLRILNQTVDKFVIQEGRTFKINPFLFLEEVESITRIVKEYPIKTTIERVTHKGRVNAWVYKTANNLFKQFREIRMRQQPDYKVLLEIPPGYDLVLGSGLKDLLGFVDYRFKTGHYIRFYPFELDANLSEIFVYSDIVSSSYVEDFYMLLLRIMPCLNEKGEQIVKYYEKPIYFPSRNISWTPSK